MVERAARVQLLEALSGAAVRRRAGEGMKRYLLVRHVDAKRRRDWHPSAAFVSPFHQAATRVARASGQNAL